MKQVYVEGVGWVDVGITALHADSAESIPKELINLRRLSRILIRLRSIFRKIRG